MNSAIEPSFWMGGLYATQLLEVTNDPSKIDSGFWAITTTFDGKFTAAKFGKVEERSWPFLYEPLKSDSWNSSHTRDEYCALVEKFRNEIAEGNVYQVNACRLLTLDSNESIKGLVAGFLESNPAKYAGYLALPGLEIASASPETFIERNGVQINSSPIKGTRPPGLAGEFPEKDKSENVMIVDLMRNDFGRICIEDSIKVPNLLEIKDLPGLTHLVSDVVGNLRDSVTWKEILEATLPPGSVSGAPKISAIELINKYEEIDRGPYCGAFGWIHGDRAELAVAIRTFWSDGEKIKFGTGAGITWASVAQDEWEETELKASRLIAIANGKFEASDGWASGEGVFETTRVEDGEIFAFERHYERAKAASNSLGFSIPSKEEVLNQTKSAVAKSNYKLGRLRLQFGSDGKLTINYGPYEDLKKPARLMIFKEANLDFNIRFKEYPYKNLEILSMAKSSGFDDGILIAPDKQLTETTVTSLLFKINGYWITPPMNSGILPGVVRAIVLESGLAKEDSVYLSDLSKIESAIMLSSLRNAQPVESIEGNSLKIDQGKCEEVSKVMAGYKGQ